MIPPIAHQGKPLRVGLGTVASLLQERFDGPINFQASHSAHGKRLAFMETASRVPKREVFLKRPNLLICREMRSGGTTRLIKLPRWHCQGDGTVPVFWRVKGNVFGITAVRIS